MPVERQVGLEVHLVANAHIDPVWLWDWWEGMHEALRTFASAMARLDETPERVFTASSVNAFMPQGWPTPRQSAHPFVDLCPAAVVR